MARGVNKVILIGKLGKDPETRYMPSGGAVTNVTLATNETWKDKATGENKERTEWHRVVFYQKLAEIVAQYLKKGAQVYVEGSIRTQKWQDKEGHDRYTTEIVASEMQMLDGKPGGGGSASMDRDSSGGEGGGGYGAARGKSGGSAPSAPAPAPDKFEDDDIPF